jgi:hypothetical protein
MTRALPVALVSCIAFLPSGGAVAAVNPLIPTPIGPGARYHPRALTASVVHRQEVAGLRCSNTSERRVGVHVEVFGRGLAVVVPAGIGVAPPWRAVQPHVLTGRCSYEARTRTPTGVIEVVAGSRLGLGQFFDLWGQPLGDRRVAGFRALRGEHVRAYVGGSPWRGAVRAIPLRRHAQIVLELGAYVPPHVTYRFGMGL